MSRDDDATGFSGMPDVEGVSHGHERSFGSALAIAARHHERARLEKWTPERAWMERTAQRKTIASEAELAAFLMGEWEFWTGHALRDDERAHFMSTVRAVWTNALAAQVA